VAPARRRSFRKRTEDVLGRDWIAAWIFYLPTAILLFGLIAWPFLQGVYVGFTRTIGTAAHIGPWIGLQNYIDLLTDRDFWFSLGITVKFTFLAEIFKPLLGVIAALLIHNLKRYRTIVSAAILLPWIVPSIVQALIWRAMYDPIFGAFNYILLQLHIVSKGLEWLGTPDTALYSVVLVNVWAGIPFFTITNLAGLKSVDPDLYAAAAVDGANAWQRFRYVTLPGIQYTLIVSTLLSTIWTMNNFGTIYLLTAGGPLDSTRVIGILTYERGFSAGDFGSGVAISLITLPVFGAVIWFLAAYMRAGTRAEASDVLEGQLRIVGTVLRPVRLFFTGLFNGGERIAEWIGGGLKQIRGRGKAQSTVGARSGRRFIQGFALTILALLLLFELFPFYFAFVTAFKGLDQVESVDSIFWPQPWTLFQFNLLFSETDFGTWYKNTVIVAIVATAVGVLAAAAGAYALSRLRWRGSGLFSSLMLISYMMPGVVMLIPFYQIMAWLHLQNTLYALMVTYPSFELPFASWLLMSYYRSIPEELEDAARIDGANRFQVFFRLILPLSKPALMAVALFALTAAWNEFFLAYILIRSDRFFTLAIGLFQLIFNDVFPIGEMMAASLLMAVPVLIVYGYAQKFMVEGLTVGSVKG
jgi:multiple sugar transport system permease protein